MSRVRHHAMPRGDGCLRRECGHAAASVRGGVTSMPEVTARQCFVARGRPASEQNCEFLVVAVS